MSAPSIVVGFLIVLGLIVVTVPIVLIGEASSWLPQGRGGWTIAGLAEGLVVVAAAVVYRVLVRRARGGGSG